MSGGKEKDAMQRKRGHSRPNGSNKTADSKTTEQASSLSDKRQQHQREEEAISLSHAAASKDPYVLYYYS